MYAEIALKNQKEWDGVVLIVTAPLKRRMTILVSTEHWSVEMVKQRVVCENMGNHWEGDADRESGDEEEAQSRQKKNKKHMHVTDS